MRTPMPITIFCNPLPNGLYLLIDLDKNVRLVGEFLLQSREGANQGLHMLVRRLIRAAV